MAHEGWRERVRAAAAQRPGRRLGDAHRGKVVVFVFLLGFVVGVVGLLLLLEVDLLDDEGHAGHGLVAERAGDRSQLEAADDAVVQVAQRFVPVRVLLILCVCVCVCVLVSRKTMRNWIVVGWNELEWMACRASEKPSLTESGIHELLSQ
jgi:hypothetical protein